MSWVSLSTLTQNGMGLWCYVITSAKKERSSLVTRPPFVLFVVSTKNKQRPCAKARRGVDHTVPQLDPIRSLSTWVEMYIIETLSIYNKDRSSYVGHSCR